MKKIRYEGVDEVVYFEKLTNGLEIYMYPNNKAKNFYLTFNTKFGSLDTEFKFEKNSKVEKLPHGTAHFLEHQMFRCSDGSTAFEGFASLGSSINAYTSYDVTCYEVISSDKLKENLELLLNFVQDPYFKAANVNSEKKIIKEEINMYKDTPSSKLNFGLEYNLNINDNHKYLISGEVGDIKKITPEVLTLAYDTFYHPENMFMIITGKFKPLEILGIIKENQSKKEFNPYKNIIKIHKKEPMKLSKSYEAVKMNVNTPKIKIAYKIPKKDLKNYNYNILSIYLDLILESKFGCTSDLTESLLEENLITDSLTTSRDIRDDYVLISIETESEYKEQVIDLITNTIHNMKISKEELERFKRVSISNYILHFDDIISVQEGIQEDVLKNGKVTTNMHELYKSLSLGEANKIISLMDFSNECIYIIE